MSDLASEAMARAARSLGRTSLAELIETDHLSARAVCRLMSLSLSQSSLKDCALIITSGALSIYERDRPNWRPEDRDLAMSLVGTERFREMIEQARAFA